MSIREASQKKLPKNPPICIITNKQKCTVKPWELHAIEAWPSIAGAGGNGPALLAGLTPAYRIAHEVIFADLKKGESLKDLFTYVCYPVLTTEEIHQHGK
jgi:hypothetical protein